MSRTFWTPFAIIPLVIAAAAIHFSRALDNPHIAVLFTLNGIGFLTLVAATYLSPNGRWRTIARRVLMGYAAVTLTLFFLWGAIKGEWLPIGFASVAVELALITGLWWEDRVVIPSSASPH